MEEYNQNTPSSPDLSNAEVEKYFESGGEEAPEQDDNDSQQENQQAEEGQKPEEREENPIERNHKIALQEERERRKEYQKQLQQEQQLRTQMETRYQQMMERFMQPQQPQVQEPTYEDDPINYLLHQQQKTQSLLQQQQALEQQRMQQYEIQHRFDTVVNQYANDAKNFAQQTPDFKDAYQYLVQNRYQELKELGYDDWQADRLIKEDEMAFVAKAYEDGVNPASRVYAAAKHRGFKGNIQNNNAQKVNEYNKARESTYSLNSSGGGKEGKQGLTLEAIANMSDEEFGNLPKSQWDKLMKGY